MKELNAPNHPEDVSQLVRELLRTTSDYPVLSKHFSNRCIGMLIRVQENSYERNLSSERSTDFFSQAGITISAVGQATDKLWSYLTSFPK